MPAIFLIKNPIVKGTVGIFVVDVPRLDPFTKNSTELASAFITILKCAQSVSTARTPEATVLVDEALVMGRQFAEVFESYSKYTPSDPAKELANDSTTNPKTE